MTYFERKIAKRSDFPQRKVGCKKKKIVGCQTESKHERDLKAHRKVL